MTEKRENPAPAEEKLTEEEILTRIIDDPDFIHCPETENSCRKFVERNPDGVGDDKIAKVLRITSDEVSKIYRMAVVKLRSIMKVS